MSAGRRGLELVALVFSGAVQAAISAPQSWIALHPVAWVPALWVISQRSGRSAFRAGWLVGATADACIFAWLVHTVATFTQLGPLAGVTVLAGYAAVHGLYAGFFAWGFAAVRRVAGPAWPLAIAVWFTACEFLAPQLFPYFQGVAWYVEPRIFLATATTGIAGVTLLVLYANAVVLQAILWLGSRSGGRALAANAVALAALVAIALGLAQRQEARVAAAEREATLIRVALVQPGTDPLDEAVRDPDGARRRAERLAAQVRAAVQADRAIDAVVLPEKAIEFEPWRPWNRAVRELPAALGVEVWTGGAAVDESGPQRRFFNSAFRLRPDGAESPRYDKNVLVPFGERMPLGPVLAWLGPVIGRSAFAAGDTIPLYDALGARFAFLVCYEAILPSYVQRPVREGANLLVNLTYDGWFGDTAEPAQHLMLVAGQAARLGVPILRATTTGLTAIIDARGRIESQTALFERTVLAGDVRPLRASGLAVAWGDWLAWSCVGVAAVLLAVGRIRAGRLTAS